jgi:hypothetical protein
VGAADDARGARASVSLLAIMKLLGHLKPEMTMLYVETSLLDLQREFNLARSQPRHLLLASRLAASIRENAQDKPSGNRRGEAVTNHYDLLSRLRPSALSNVCAICVPPGARLILKDISAEMQRDLGLCPEECGKFTKTSAETHRGRHAIVLANGCVIPLQRLCEGQRVEVLSLVPPGEFVEERQNALVR